MTRQAEPIVWDPVQESTGNLLDAFGGAVQGVTSYFINKFRGEVGEIIEAVKWRNTQQLTAVIGRLIQNTPLEKGLTLPNLSDLDRDGWHFFCENANQYILKRGAKRNNYINLESVLNPDLYSDGKPENYLEFNEYDEEGHTPIYYYCYHLNDKAVALLAEYSDLNMLDRATGVSLLSTVILKNAENKDQEIQRRNIISLLLKKECQYEIQDNNEKENTPLHHACNVSDQNTVGILCNRYDKSGDVFKNKLGFSPLVEAIYACKGKKDISSESKEIGIIKKLLKSYEDIMFIKDNMGNTPLHHACELGCAQVVKLLCKNLGDKLPKAVKKENKDGDTPIALAGEINNKEEKAKILNILNQKLSSCSDNKQTIFNAKRSYDSDRFDNDVAEQFNSKKSKFNEPRPC